jgi:hypothetical protein
MQAFPLRCRLVGAAGNVVLHPCFHVCHVGNHCPGGPSAMATAPRCCLPNRDCHPTHSREQPAQMGSYRAATRRQPLQERFLCLRRPSVLVSLHPGAWSAFRVSTLRGAVALYSGFGFCAPARTGAVLGSNNPMRTKEVAIRGLRMGVFSSFVAMIPPRLRLRLQVSGGLRGGC